MKTKSTNKSKQSSGELTFDPGNVRSHNEKNKKVIRRSLEEIGPFRSIAIDKDYVVRAGNGVFEQAKELGLKIRVVDSGPDELIAVRRADLSGERAVRASILDNRANELSEWNHEGLAEVLKDLQKSDVDLSLLGWEPHEIEGLLTTDWSPLPDTDEKTVTFKSSRTKLAFTKEQWAVVQAAVKKVRKKKGESLSEADCIVCLCESIK